MKIYWWGIARQIGTEYKWVTVVETEKLAGEACRDESYVIFPITLPALGELPAGAYRPKQSV
jgi:hypothetical protein